MNKLALVILVSVCLTRYTTAQTIIKIVGDVDKSAVKRQVAYSLDYLDIHKTVHLYIVFSDRMPKYLKGLTFSVPSASDVHFIQVRINTRLDEKQRTYVLAHEMMHVRQYLSGDLKIVDGKKIWKDKTYPFAHRDLRKFPWEAEAYRYDQYLGNALKKLPAKAPVLAASEPKE